MRGRRIEQAFLPATLELQATPPSPVGRWMLWSLLGLLVAIVAWSYWARIDIVASASGKLIPANRVKVVQAFERGVVSAIHVADGVRVNRGDLLIEFDSTEATARLRQVENELESLRARLARLSRLKHFIAPQAASPEQTHFVLSTAERTLLDHEREQHAKRLAQFAGRREQHEQELQTVMARIEGLRDIIELVTRRSEALDKLATVGHVATEAWLRVAQEQRGLETEFAVLHGQRKTLLAAMVNLGRSEDAYLAERLREVTDAQVIAQHQRVRLEQELAAARLRLERHRVLAPASGRVQQLAVHTVGGVVTPAQELMRIVPMEGELEIEAHVLNRDSGEVRPGMPAEVKIQAYPFTRYGTLAAEIVALSADALAKEALGLVYKARVRLTSLTSAAERGLQLEPGMTVTVEIRTGERRVIELLLNPLVKALKEAGRER